MISPFFYLFFIFIGIVNILNKYARLINTLKENTIINQFPVAFLAIELFYESLAYRRILAAPLRAKLGLSPVGGGGRSILQLIYVPIVSAHWVTKYPGTGLRTLTAVVTACNDRRYRQFHRIRPRVSCVCMGAACEAA